MTYVPARNTIFVSGTGRGFRGEFCGVNALDYSGYPDCRPDYIKAFQRMANLATKLVFKILGVRIQAPLLKLSKAEIISRGIALGVNYSITMSCYDPPDGDYLFHFGTCDACRLRKEGFATAGIADPTRYT